MKTIWERYYKVWINRELKSLTLRKKKPVTKVTGFLFLVTLKIYFQKWMKTKN